MIITSREKEVVMPLLTASKLAPSKSFLLLDTDTTKIGIAKGNPNTAINTP